MRYILVMIIVVLARIQIYSQDVPVILPDEPIAQGGAYWGLNHIIWLDNETLLVETVEEQGTLIAYIYDIVSDERSLLESSPLYFDPSLEEIEHFQVSTETISGLTLYASFQSPFADERGFNDVIYPSTQRVYCGLECNGQLWMFGKRTGDDLMSATYRPLNLLPQCGSSMIWTRDRKSVLVSDLSCYGYSISMHSVELIYPYRVTSVGELSDVDGKILAVSDDGHHVLYLEFDSLRYWKYEHEINDTFEQTKTSIQLVASDNNFAGANFINENPNNVLMIMNDGLVKIDLTTNEHQIINPDLNAIWIELAFFSPDNHHVAVIYDGALYVIETGF